MIIILMGILCVIITAVVASVFNLKKLYAYLLGIGLFISSVLIYSNNNSNFSGNIEKDAVILNERIFEDGENSDDVIDELIEFYVEKGYGMKKCDDVLELATEIRYKSR